MLYGYDVLREPKSIQVLREKYDYIFENSNNIESIITEANMSKIQQSVDDFVEDAHRYIDEVKDKKNSYAKLAEGFILAGLGTYVLGLCVGAGIPVLGIIILIGSIVLSIISIINSTKAQREYKKLEDLKSNLIREKSKLKNIRDKQKINEILERIDHEIDINYRNQPNQNVNYNYNI